MNESIEAAKRVSRLSNYSKKSPEVTSPISQKTRRSPLLDNSSLLNSEVTSDNQNEIAKLNSDFNFNGSDSKQYESSRVEKMKMNNNQEKSYMKMTKHYEVIVTQNDALNQPFVSDNFEVIKDSPLRIASKNYSKEVHIKKTETIFIDDQIAMSSSFHKHQTNRSNETNSKLTYISINSPSGNEGDKSNHNDNQVKIFSHLNNDSDISKQLSPSKIRIFVPYKNENQDQVDSSTIPNKDLHLPVVET